MELDLNKAQKGEPITILYMGQKITFNFSSCDINQEMQAMDEISFHGYSLMRPSFCTPRLNLNLSGYAIQVEPDSNFNSSEFYSNPFGIPGMVWPTHQNSITKNDIKNMSKPTDNDIEKYFSNPDEEDLPEKSVDGSYLDETTY